MNNRKDKKKATMQITECIVECTELKSKELINDVSGQLKS